jgi:hypothetical protein
VQFADASYAAWCSEFAFKYHKALKFITMVSTITVTMVHVLSVVTVVATNYHGCHISAVGLVLLSTYNFVCLAQLLPTVQKLNSSIDSKVASCG